MCESPRELRVENVEVARVNPRVIWAEITENSVVLRARFVTRARKETGLSGALSTLRETIIDDANKRKNG
jgi:hypothetical protein